MKFVELGLIDPILKALEDVNYVKPTEIQEKAIPLVLDKKDVLGCAQTGTGKTAAFAIPIIQRIHEIEASKNQPVKLRGLIITPTRELAIQIEENLACYSKYTKVRHTVIFGGVKQMKQVKRLDAGVHIIVATPGRLLDLINQGIIHLDTIKMFVLDEADRMLDMGFIHDIKKILALLPKQKQSLFFSATMPNNIVKLSRDILNDPVKIEVAPVSSAAETVNQLIYYTNSTTKRSLLLHLLKEKNMDQVLLFCRTKHGADKIAKFLRAKRIDTQAIHGDKSQNQRQNALSKFKSKELKVLVATDIAARGIDIDKLKYVINFNIPHEPETYVHRIGRTGRAGEEGQAISFSGPEENVMVRDIEKLINRKIEVIEDNPFPQTDKPMTAAEKKEFNKEKQRRKQEFFANRKKKRNQSNSNSRGRRR